MSATASRHCPACSRTFRRDVDFCFGCGTPLQDSPAPPDPNVGKIIDDRYVLEVRLGEGGMGVVYRARHLHSENKFAVKLLHYDALKDDRARLRFLREAKATAAIDHPNAVYIYDYGTWRDNEPYIVLEYLEGVTVYDTLQQHPERRLSPGQAVDITLALCRVLGHAHQLGIVHRDLKPENVLLVQRNRVPDWPILLDFGVARIIDQAPLTWIGHELVGTPLYLAPEALTSPAAPPMDLYAVGILLHELIAGTPPFKGEVPSLLYQHAHVIPAALSQRSARTLPPALDQLVAKLLAKSPAARPSAAEAEAALQAIRTQLPPRSLSGLMQAKTMLLHRSGPSAARTVLLPGSAEGQPTLALPVFLQQIDEVEETLASLASELAGRLPVLGKRLWGDAWPPDAAALRADLFSLEVRLEEQGVDLALLRSQIEEEAARVHTQQEQHRRRLLHLIDRLRLAALSPPERQQVEVERQEVEQALHRNVARDDGLARLHDSLEQAVQTLRSDLHSVLRRLSRRLLETVWAQSLQAERARLNNDLTKLEATLGMQAVLLQSQQTER